MSIYALSDIDATAILGSYNRNGKTASEYYIGKNMSLNGTSSQPWLVYIYYTYCS